MTADRTPVADRMIVDGEWADWMADWQATAAPPKAPPIDDLRRRAWRHGLGLVALTFSEIVFSAAILAYVVHMAWQKGTAVAQAICLATVLLLVLAWIYTIWNRRGTWRPVAHSTRAFVEIELLRARRRLRTLRGLPAFVALELAIVLPLAVWRVWSNPERLEMAPRVAVNLAVFGLVLVVVLIFVRRFAARTEREIDKLEELSRGMS